MPVINFKARFEPALLAGSKRQTIRKKSRVLRPGATLDLAVSRQVIASVVCTAVQSLDIATDGIILNGVMLSAEEAQRFAEQDGFASVSEMLILITKLYGPLPLIDRLVCITW